MAGLWVGTLGLGNAANEQARDRKARALGSRDAKICSATSNGLATNGEPWPGAIPKPYEFPTCM